MPTWDGECRERFLTWQPKDLLNHVSRRKGAWYWDNAPQKLRHHEHCCSTDMPIVFHNYRGTWVNKAGKSHNTKTPLDRMRLIYRLVTHVPSAEVKATALADKTGYLHDGGTDRRIELEYLVKVARGREERAREFPPESGRVQIGRCDDDSFDTAAHYTVPTWWKVAPGGEWWDASAPAGAGA